MNPVVLCGLVVAALVACVAADGFLLFPLPWESFPTARSCQLTMAPHINVLDSEFVVTWNETQWPGAETLLIELSPDGDGDNGTWPLAPPYEVSPGIHNIMARVPNGYVPCPDYGKSGAPGCTLIVRTLPGGFRSCAQVRFISPPQSWDPPTASSPRPWTSPSSYSPQPWWESPSSNAPQPYWNAPTSISPTSHGICRNFPDLRLDLSPIASIFTYPIRTNDSKNLFPWVFDPCSTESNALLINNWPSPKIGGPVAFANDSMYSGGANGQVLIRLQNFEKPYCMQALHRPAVLNFWLRCGHTNAALDYIDATRYSSDCEVSVHLTSMYACTVAGRSAGSKPAKSKLKFKKVF